MFSYIVNVYGDIMYFWFELENYEIVEYFINFVNVVDVYG